MIPRLDMLLPGSMEEHAVVPDAFIGCTATYCIDWRFQAEARIVQQAADIPI